jgi:glycosyltransferase involved in cell wall biosynthesis
MSQRVLFFVNNLNRTGSETLILNLINDLNKQKEVEIGVVLFQKGGDLVSEIASNIPVFYLDLEFSLMDKLLFHSGIDVIGNKIAKIHHQFHATTWYFNTFDHVGLLKYKERFNCRAFVHVHEMIGRFDSINKNELYSIIEYCDHLIACSSLIKELFETFFPKPITVINSTIDFGKIGQFKKPKTFNPNEKVTVLTSGTISYNKGADIFYEVAKLVSKDTFEFVWLGKPNQTAFSEIVRLKNEETNSVQFVQTSTQEEYLELFSQANIFLSTSREESMGLVLMEAIALEIPVLATNSGGSTLIVDDQVGQICEDLRPEIIAQQLVEMSKNLDQFSFSGGQKFLYSEELEKLIQVVH